MSRNRIIYQSKALFIAPNATGVQMALTGDATPQAAQVNSKTGPIEDPSEIFNGTGLLYKLDRLQNLNFGFTVNAQDVNEMGKLSRLSRISNEPPSVNVDFSYYVTDGLNERLLGFNFGGVDNATAGAETWDTNMIQGAGAFSGFLEETQGQNFYIVTTSEGEDVVGANIDSNDSVIAIGNGFLTNYELNATVGELPTANVTIEAFNIKTNDFTPSSQGISGISPSVDLNSNPVTAFTSADSGRYFNLNSGLFDSTVGDGGRPDIAALRPGDITVTTFASAGGTEGKPGNNQAEEFIVFDSSDSANTMHIQSVTFALPLARTVLNRLGSFFGYARVVDVPLNMEVTISAFANEFETNKNVYNTLCGNQTERSFRVDMNQCADAGETRDTAFSYEFRGAILTSENHTTDIGGNETVDLTYSIQIGGANDTGNGLFMSGSYNSGVNTALEAAYPYGGNVGADYTGFASLVENFFKLGSSRNY
jgi:hypothetical protein